MCTESDASVKDLQIKALLREGMQHLLAGNILRDAPSGYGVRREVFALCGADTVEQAIQIVTQGHQMARWVKIACQIFGARDLGVGIPYQPWYHECSPDGLASLPLQVEQLFDMSREDYCHSVHTMVMRSIELMAKYPACFRKNGRVAVAARDVCLALLSADSARAYGPAEWHAEAAFDGLRKEPEVTLAALLFNLFGDADQTK